METSHAEFYDSKMQSLCKAWFHLDVICDRTGIREVNQNRLESYNRRCLAKQESDKGPGPTRTHQLEGAHGNTAMPCRAAGCEGKFQGGHLTSIFSPSMNSCMKDACIVANKEIILCVTYLGLETLLR